MYQITFQPGGKTVYASALDAIGLILEEHFGQYETVSVKAIRQAEQQETAASQAAHRKPDFTNHTGDDYPN